MAKPPKPDRDLVNLGAILDQPFLFQANNPSTTKVPGSQAFMTLSTLIPSGTAQGTAQYTFGPLKELVREVQTTSGAVKTTEYLYSPGDPAQIIAALEARATQQEAECVRLKKSSPDASKAIESARVRLRSTQEKLAEARRQKAAPPPRLVRTKWTEVGDGDLMVNGETVFHYEGTDIVRSKSTITTQDTPPRVDELETSYRYNDLGQVHEIETAGSVTKCEYDPIGRLAKKSGGFISPAGDFLADHRTLFAYTPPVGDPNQIPPPNALLSSVNDSISGPLPAFEETPEPMKKIPEPSLAPPGTEPKSEAASAREKQADAPRSWLGRLLGGPKPSAEAEDSAGAATLVAPAVAAPPLPLPKLPGKLDTTRVQSTYAYP